MSSHLDSEIDGILSEFLSGAEQSRPEDTGQTAQPCRNGDGSDDSDRTMLFTTIVPSLSNQEPDNETSEFRTAEERTAYRPKARSGITAAVHTLSGFTGAVLSVLLLCWVALTVHPSSGSGQTTSLQKADPVSRLEMSLVNYKADALKGLAYIKKIYAIPENAAAAPVPNPYAFHSLDNADAQKMELVIQEARDSGLLDDQETVAFRTDVPFYHDADVEYYLDDTILVICWKEVIDGSTCTFCEVKVGDGSQFRRKFINDTFSADIQDYATNIARSVNAVVAMNADYYAFRDFGIVVYQRKLYRFNEETYTGDYRKYNCVDTLLVDEKGDFHFFHRLDQSTPEQMQRYIDENNIIFSVSFGPVLVENGVLQSCDWYPAGEVNTGYSRAGIGQLGERHYLYMSLNHSPEKLARWTVNEFAGHFFDKGVKDAYNLDGGQTSEIVFQGRPYNYIDFDAERAVTDILYFGTAINYEEGAGVER